MFKNSLMTAAILVSLAGHVVAAPLPADHYLDRIPTQFRGLWCAENDAGPLFVRSCTGVGADNTMTVTERGYETSETRCEHTKIIIGSASNAAPDPKSRRSLAVKFFCAQKKDMGPNGDPWSPDHLG